MDRRTYILSFIVLMCLMTVGSDRGFAQQQYTLTVSKSGSGYGTVTSSPPGIDCGMISPADCTEAYNSGKRVTLKAKPETSSSFAGWSGGGCSGTKTCAVIMDNDITVQATFEKKVPKISLSADHLDFGTVEEGKKATQTITFSNTGTGDLQITFSVDGDFFSTSGKSNVTIKPGKSHTLKVTFYPISPSGEFESTESVLPFKEDIEEETGSGKPTTCTGMIHCMTNDPNATSIDLPVKGNYIINTTYFAIELVYEYWTKGVSADSTFEMHLNAGGEVYLYYVSPNPDNENQSLWVGQNDIQCSVNGSRTDSSGTTTTTGNGPVSFSMRAISDRTSLTIKTFDEVGSFPITICYNGECSPPVPFPWEEHHEGKVAGDYFTFPLKDGACIISCGKNADYFCNPNEFNCEKKYVEWPYPMDETCLIYELFIMK